MPYFGTARADVIELWQRVAEERRRAHRVAALAASFERDADQLPTARRALRLRMAELHRRTAARHLTSAKLHKLHAQRLQKWIDNADRSEARPAFITAVAAALGEASTAITMLGPRGAEAVLAASDSIAKAAHELEFVLGEGPGTDAIAAGEPVLVSGPMLADRWPEFGPAAADIGVRAVLAAPLLLPTSCVGALCVYGSQAVISEDVTTATEQIADALVRTVLTPAHADAAESGDELPVLPLLDEADFQAAINQAAGMTSVTNGCTIDDAFALLRARAFAEGRSVEDIAQGIVDGRLRLS